MTNQHDLAAIIGHRCLHGHPSDEAAVLAGHRKYAWHFIPKLSKLLSICSDSVVFSHVLSNLIDHTRHTTFGVFLILSINCIY